MRVASLGVARPAYYDRNAASINGNYGATVGPHTGTTRFTYTVPASKKCLVEATFGVITRATAATTAGLVAVYAGTSTVRSINIVTTNNTVPVALQDKSYTQLTVYSGASFTAVSQDGSTGGTNEIIIQFSGTEFDA